MAIPDMMPNDIETLRTALAAEQRWHGARRRHAPLVPMAMVAHLKLLIAKLRHERFGASSERGRKLLDQMELQLEELEAAAAEDASATVKDTVVEAFSRRRPTRAPLPEHLPRERVVIPGPAACPCCGGRLAKLGETITETLEVIPRQWKGGADGAREVHLPRLRGHHAATSPIPSHRARQSGTEPAGHDPDRQVL